MTEQRNIVAALKAMVRGHEADCECRKVQPDSMVDNHTWLAIAYRESVHALSRLQGGGEADG